MQYQQYLSLVLLVVLSACGGPGDTVLDIVYDPCEPILVVPAADTTDAERCGIADAIVSWDAVLDNGLTVEATSAAQRLPISFEKGALMFFGIYRDEEGDIVINRGLTDPRDRAVVIAHEMGHALGLWHEDDRVSVMNRGNADIPPNTGDAAKVMALWGDCRDRRAMPSLIRRLPESEASTALAPPPSR